MRRSLALQVGQERHALGARARSSPLRAFERKFAVALRAELSRELAPVPSESAARREHHAHQVPSVGDHVTERVRAHAGIDQRTRRRGEHGARRPPARHGFARRHQPDSHGAARVVGAAADDRRARGEPCCRCCLRRDLAEHLGAAADVGQELTRAPAPS